MSESDNNNGFSAVKHLATDVLITKPKAFLGDVRNAFKDARQELQTAAVARIVSLAVLFPLDAAKTRIQVSSATSRRAVGVAFRGGPAFAGLLPAVVGHVPHGALAFAVFAALASHVEKPARDDRHLIPAAVTADAIAALWLAPAEAIKIRMQTGMARSAAAVARGTSPVHGVLAQIARDAPFRALQVLAFARTRAVVARRAGRELTRGESVAVGAGVGATVAAVTTPLDVVRSRVMAQRTGVASMYRNCADCFTRTLNTEGVSSLFRGLMPRVVYMAASVAVFSLAYESVRQSMPKVESASAKVNGKRRSSGRS